jgi:serine protease inhibitor
MKNALVAGFVLALTATPTIAADKPAKNPVAEGNTQFATELYSKLSSQKGNLFVSPFSISTALGMTSAGAKGKTLDEMNQTLHLPAVQAETHAGFAALIKTLNAEGTDPAKRGYELSVANALWGQKGADWQPTFLETTGKNYGAGLRELDFMRTEAARQTINQWVEQQTKDKIKDLIKEGVLQPDTQLVLTNAIYFKGSWAIEFNKKATKDEPFFIDGSKEAKTAMMHISSGYRYHEEAGFQALELPYKGKELSMVIFLPRKKDGLAEFEKTLSAARLNEWLGKLRMEETVIVTLPKFKMTSEFSLSKTLSEMGMKLLFSDGADLSAMNGKGGLFVSDAIHKAFVDVNEEGTEAAAATAIVVRPTSARIDPKPTPVFKADHPFFFAIRDQRTGSVLFVGRVTDPTGK